MYFRLELNRVVVVQFYILILFWVVHAMETLYALLAPCEGIHQSQVDFPHEGPVMWPFKNFFVVNLTKLLNKQLSCWWFEMLWCSCHVTVKVRLHGTRQAARLARDMLQRDLLCGNSIYMVSSCRTRLLHIIHVSAFWGSVFFKENWGNCSRQHVPRGNYKLKLKLPPGLTAPERLLRAACRLVNAPVVCLCFYICGAAVCLSRPV